MKIKVTCNACESVFHVGAEHAGKRASCAKCGKAIIVPSGIPSRVNGQSPVTSVMNAAPTITAEQIQKAFSGPIEPVPTSMGYRIWASVAALVMILLPMIYIGIIVGVTMLVYYHAVNHVGMFQGIRGRGVIMVFLAYLAPLIAGVIAILFMLKPLLARPARPAKSLELSPDKEPVLFAFIHRLCEVVGAPRPKTIEVTCEVNAAASFRSGSLSMLIGNDLKLIIGAPLAAGLDLRSFAGVLGHEFGHFRQGAGMRLTYIVRSISFWFTRVVYERDQWDERLSATASGIDIRIGWVLYFAMFVVWLTRRILWVLMNIGNLVAGFLLRQMEFDADRCEARVAGDTAFEKTCRRIANLSVASEISHNQVGAFYQEGRLADSLPLLILDNVDDIPEEILKEIDKSIATRTTGLFDTHPADHERIANARLEKTNGVFQMEIPTTTLFSDFKSLSREVTLGFYREVLGPQIKREDLHPHEAIMAHRHRQKEDAKSLQRFYLDEFQILRPVSVAPANLTPANDPKSTARELAQVRESMFHMRETYAEASTRYDDADTNLLEAAMVDAWTTNRLKLPSGIIETEKHGRVSAEQIRSKASAEQQGCLPTLQPFEQAAHRRLVCAMHLLFTPQVAQRIPDSDELQHEARTLVAALQYFNASMENELVFRNHRTGLLGLLSRFEQNQENQVFVNAVLSMNERLHAMFCELRKQFMAVPYPFDHAVADMTIGLYAAESIPVKDEIGEVLEATETLGESLMNLRARIHARLAFIAEQVETGLGLEPFEIPEKEEPKTG